MRRRLIQLLEILTEFLVGLTEWLVYRERLAWARRASRKRPAGASGSVTSRERRRSR